MGAREGFCKTFFLKTRLGEWGERDCVSARWLITTTTSLFLTLNIWQISHHLQIARLIEACLALGNGTIMLRSELRQNFAKLAKNFRLWKSIRKQIRPSCRKTSDLILCLFGLMKATKSRDSSEYSQCVQNVLAKGCLPCQNFIQIKKNCWARKGLGTS